MCLRVLQLSGDREVPEDVGLGRGHSYQGLETGAQLFTVPFTKVPSRFGTWNVHAGADGFAFGDTTKAFNINKDGEVSGSAFTALFGVGVSY